MRCTRCREESWVEVRRHNASYCGDCFQRFFHDQVERAISHDKMFGHSQKILVAVSGGKDSLALWDVLLDLGYDADGLYIDLGIGEYSSNSRVMSEQFAAARERKLHIASLDQRYGVTVPLIAEQTRRAPCSGCGLAKRYLFNREAAERGYDVVATGHNLDDEAATRLGRPRSLRPRTPAWSARSSRSTGCRSTRRPPTPSSKASSTSSRSAR